MWCITSVTSVAAEVVVWGVRARIFERTRLTASAGIGPNRMLAKISSDFRKPNNQYYLAPDRDVVLAFMHALPIRKVGGIGNVGCSAAVCAGTVCAGDGADAEGARHQHVPGHVGPARVAGAGHTGTFMHHG